MSRITLTCGNPGTYENRRHDRQSEEISHGLSRNKELFLPYDEFPWFKDQNVSAILNVEEPRENHFHWPAMDVDLTLDMIEHPERYPLKAQGE